MFMGMGRTRIARVASYALLCVATVDSECLLPELWIDSVNLEGISGCFEETIYTGLYSTRVWTLGGVDIAAGGTTGIIAELPDGSTFSNNSDPIWSIGTVVPNATNTWSDGYSVGLWVTELVCTGTSPFWETDDPTEETQWSCDSNNDGTPTVGEGNGFVVTCGCPDANGVVPTVTPTPSLAPSSPEPTLAVLGSTEAPASTAVITSPPAIPSTLEPSVDQVNSTVSVTPAPSIGETSSPACNLTLTSESIPEIEGCYYNTAIINSRGRWIKPGGLVSIEWESSNSSGFWVVLLAGVGGVDNYKCINDEDIADPTALDVTDWICDKDLPADERGVIDALECSSESCESSEAASGVGLSASSTTAIVAGSVIGGFMLAGLILAGFYVIKRRRSDKAKGVEPAAENTPPVDPNAPPAPVPVFEPWGTRPPPKCYG